MMLNEKKMVSLQRSLVFGGLTGALVICVPMVLFFILAASGVALGENAVTSFFVTSLGLLEVPVVTIGRALRLPIETGGTAFLIYNLNLFGYLLVIVFWVVVGMIMAGIARMLLKLRVDK